MLRTTPQERQALGVTALLLIAGAGVRLFSLPEGGVEWEGAASDTLVVNSLAGVRAGAEAELAREKIRSRPLAEGERIDPNRADALQLDRLPKVGRALAERIVAWREEHGPYRSLADLDSVSGVGPALLEALEPHLTLPARPAGTTRRAAPAPDRASRAGRGAGRPLELNRATEAELTGLPGIGPALAGRIVAMREAQGKFRSVDELEKVAGIGPSLLERLRPLVTVSP